MAHSIFIVVDFIVAVVISCFRVLFRCDADTDSFYVDILKRKWKITQPNRQNVKRLTVLLFWFRWGSFSSRQQQQQQLTRLVTECLLYWQYFIVLSHVLTHPDTCENQFLSSFHAVISIIGLVSHVNIPLLDKNVGYHSCPESNFHVKMYL